MHRNQYHFDFNLNTRRIQIKLLLSDGNKHCPPGGQPTGHHKTLFIREQSGSVIEHLTQERGAAGSSLTNVSALCP